MLDRVLTILFTKGSKNLFRKPSTQSFKILHDESFFKIERIINFLGKDLAPPNKGWGGLMEKKIAQID